MGGDFFGFSSQLHGRCFERIDGTGEQEADGRLAAWDAGGDMQLGEPNMPMRMAEAKSRKVGGSFAITQSFLLSFKIDAEREVFPVPSTLASEYQKPSVSSSMPPVVYSLCDRSSPPPPQRCHGV